MNRTKVSRWLLWLGSLAATGQAAAQESPLWAEIDKVARAPVDTSKLTCRTDSAQPEPELAKARAALRARYPGLPWEKIKALAEEVGSQDLAIVLGTNCQDYVFSTRLRALEGAAFAGLECKDKPGIDLAACLHEITCEKVGRYSRACGARFSWERGR